MTTAHNPSEAESSGNILHPSLDLRTVYRHAVSIVARNSYLGSLQWLKHLM